MIDEKGRFIKGHPYMATGRTLFKKGRIPWSKGIKAEEDKRMREFVKSGHKANHARAKIDPHWHGDGVNYQQIHYWIRQKMGNPQECKSCGETERKLYWHNINDLYRKITEEWVSICPPCHKRIHPRRAL